MVGTILPLDRPTMRIGRSRSLELVVQEKTVSYEHATLTWQNGPWVVDDLGSTNGTFVEQDDARASRAILRYGVELQLGEMRVMLVGFREGSAHHQKALEWLAERDALTGLLGTEALRRGLEQDAELARWADLPLHQATYRLTHDGQRTEGRLTLEELLALRRIGRSIAELTDNLLLSVSPVVAGRPVVSPPGTPDLGTEIVVSLVGPTRQEAQNLVDMVAADARSRLSGRFTLDGTLRSRQPGEPIVFSPPPPPAGPPPKRAWTWRR
jgi:predicted component of type VI protein secretion system